MEVNYENPFIFPHLPDRGVRRKRDYHACIRKRNRDATRNLPSPWYGNLHEYSKGKIHCSCPLCSCKTRQKGKRDYWPIRDQKRRESMETEEKDQ